ncbi:NYN domain-containing protein [Parvularcula oceani]|uniref:NYN domain-containing protein n=1 Tax=Parvularcula oceani TaxID=1247963 RepID=UPI00138E1682|nr:NYN domain-containing protein [Parvularcula oceani]
MDYSKTPEADFRNRLHAELRQTRKFAVRLGDVYREHGWRLSEKASKAVARQELLPTDLTDDHFEFGLRQKGVDMRIGTDMASITLKRQANIIILVAGDSDFVTTAKLARREGVEVILDPMGWSVRPALFEHIDGVQTGLPRRQMPQLNEQPE